jgi:integrase
VVPLPSAIVNLVKSCDDVGVSVTGTRSPNGSGKVWEVKRKLLPPYWRGAVTLPDGSKTYVKHESRDVCQLLLDNLRERVKNGEIVRSAAVGTVGDECRAWLERRALAGSENKVKLTASSYRTYLTAIDNLVCRSDGMAMNIGKINVANLSAHHVRQWRDDLTAAGISPSYARQGYSALTQTFDALVLVEAVPANPVLKVDRPVRKETNGKGIEGEQLDELLVLLRDHRLHLRWYLAFAFGIRPAEAIAIRRKDVQLNFISSNGERYGKLTIRGQLDNKGVYLDHTKTKKERVLRLNAEVVDMFMPTSPSSRKRNAIMSWMEANGRSFIRTGSTTTFSSGVRAAASSPSAQTQSHGRRSPTTPDWNARTAT